jgi:hypothetical protein
MAMDVGRCKRTLFDLTFNFHNLLNIFNKVDRYASDRNSWGFKWLFGLSLTRYDEYEKYWMSLPTPQTHLKISGFVCFLSKIKRMDNRNLYIESDICVGKFVQ